MKNNSISNSIKELQSYNEALEQSPEYQRILPEVMNEVYSLYVNERIESLERLAEEEDEDLIENVILQNFQPSREGATNALDYVLQLKKVKIGTVESAEIVILPLPTTAEDETSGASTSSTELPKMPIYDYNPFDETVKIMENRRRSWAKSAKKFVTGSY